jgi:hypothetical protein
MVDEKILHYLSGGLSRGHSLESLKKELINHGYNEHKIDEAIKNLQNQQPNTLQNTSQNSMPQNIPEQLGLFKKIGKSIIHPIELFESTKSEKLGKPFKYQIIILLLPLIIGLISLFVFFDYISLFLSLFLSIIPGFSNLIPATAVFFSLILIFFVLVIFPIFTFIIAGGLHLIVKIFRGQGTYSSTYKAVIYCSTPSVFLGFIPYLNYAVFLWTLVLSILAVTIYHEISKLKASIIVLLPVVLLTILYFLL